MPAKPARNEVAEMAKKFLPRMIAAVLVGTGALLVTAAPVLAADKVTFLTSWFAQAEHGGFYQAKATGLYERAGLDATIKMGGPQVNGMQLLLAGETDLMMGYDLQVLKSLEQGLPVMTVGTSFQFDLQGMTWRASPISRTRPSWSRPLEGRAGGRGSRRNTNIPTSRLAPIRSTYSRSSPTRTRCS